MHMYILLKVGICDFFNAINGCHGNIFLLEGAFRRYLALMRSFCQKTILFLQVFKNNELVVTLSHTSICATLNFWLHKCCFYAI